MKHYQVSHFFPLLVLGILAGLSFWLQQATDVDLIRNDGKTRHDPDTIVENLTLHRHGEDGILRYTLTATRLEHYPDDDSSLVTRPHLTSLRPDAPDLTLAGKTARVTQEGKHILVEQDVVVTRAATKTQAEMIARTPELTILPDDGLAFNDKPVHITQGRSWMKGKGVHVDNTRGTITLQSQVTGEYFNPPKTP